MKLLSLLPLAFLAYTTLAADDSSALNEWGTYYKLEGSKFNDKQSLFTLAFNDYVDSSDKKTSCKAGDASFSRWYESSEDSDKFILSYWCMTSGARGYEHLKVSQSSETVVEWQDKLSGFGIPDAGEYSDAGNLAGDDAEEIQEDMLMKVNASVAELVDDGGDPICVNPGTQVLYSVQRKTENGLDYYKFPISCDNNGEGSHSHMTNIEVAQDNALKELNDGGPILSTVEAPQRNTEFIAAKEAEIESGKQGGSAALCASIITIAVAPMLSLLA